jgi:hypothetical protein
MSWHSSAYYTALYTHSHGMSPALLAEAIAQSEAAAAESPCPPAGAQPEPIEAPEVTIENMQQEIAELRYKNEQLTVSIKEIQAQNASLKNENYLLHLSYIDCGPPDPDGIVMN